jgi:tyrosyl-tRNA synthetase
MQYFELLTDVTDKELKEFERQLASGANPMSLKKRLARELVAQFYSEKEAREAEEHFEKTVQKKEIPEEIQQYTLSEPMFLSQLMQQSGLCASRSEATRLIKQGAVTINGEKITHVNHLVLSGAIIKVGKRRYLKTT